MAAQASVSVAEYLTEHQIAAVPVSSETEDAVPQVSIACPRGWDSIDNENFPAGYTVFAQRENQVSGWVPNVVLVVSALSVQLDPKSLLECAFVDSRRMPEWVEKATSTDAYQGCPSSVIDGSYRVESLELSVRNRYLVIESAGVQYLVQLTITIPAVDAHQLWPDVESIDTSLTIVS